MSASDLVSLFTSISAILVAVVIGCVQVNQGRQMKALSQLQSDFERRQDSRDEARLNNDLWAQASAFLMKYQSKEDKPKICLCAIAAMYDDGHAYEDRMYSEFCSFPLELQNLILERSGFDIRVDPKYRAASGSFYKEFVAVLRKEYPEGDKIYDDLKYVRNAIENFAGEANPFGDREHEDRIIDVVWSLCNSDGVHPIRQLENESLFSAAKSGGIEASALDCMVFYWFANYFSTHSRGSDDRPDYGGHELFAFNRPNMESLFLQTLHHMYARIIDPLSGPGRETVD